MATFYVGECVKSKWHGFAEVVESGENPVVAFLHGEPVRVEGDSLKVVPPWMYERAQQNLHQIERWLDLRIHGDTSRTAALAPRPAFDLETAMREQAPGLPMPKNDHPRGVIWLFD